MHVRALGSSHMSFDSCKRLHRRRILSMFIERRLYFNAIMVFKAPVRSSSTADALKSFAAGRVAQMRLRRHERLKRVLMWKNSTHLELFDGGTQVQGDVMTPTLLISTSSRRSDGPIDLR